MKNHDKLHFWWTRPANISYSGMTSVCKPMVRGTTWPLIFIAVLLLGCGVSPPTATPEPTPKPIEITKEQIVEIDGVLDANIAIYGDEIGKPLTEADRQELCQDWEKAGWNSERIPNSRYNVLHGELPNAIREVTRSSPATPAELFLPQYCAHK